MNINKLVSGSNYFMNIKKLLCQIFEQESASTIISMCFSVKIDLKMLSIPERSACQGLMSPCGVSDSVNNEMWVAVIK